MDSAYLKQHVGDALSSGLAEVCQRRPFDPIEYLAKWLRKYVENLKYEKQESEEAVQLAHERQQAEEERRVQEALLEEQKQIANEIKRKELENQALSATAEISPTEPINEDAPEVTMATSETQIEDSDHSAPVEADDDGENNTDDNGDDENELKDSLELS